MAWPQCSGGAPVGDVGGVARSGGWLVTPLGVFALWLGDRLGPEAIADHGRMTSSLLRVRGRVSA